MITCIANLIYATRFLMPLGDDGTILMWPAGYWITHLPWYQIPKFLGASFIGEDHLGPLHYLLGYVLYQLPLSPEMAMNLADKVLFVGVIISAFAVATSLWGTQSKTLIFFAFVIPNTAMTWRIIVFNGGYNFSALAVYATLYLYLQHLKTPRLWGALVFSVAFLAMTFTFESTFLGLPLFAALTLFQTESSTMNSKLRLLFVNGGWLIMLFLPYLVIHYTIYGTILPTSRVGVLAQGNPIGLVLRGIFATWSEWLFDIPKVMLQLFFGEQRWQTGMAISNLGWPAFISQTIGLVAVIVLAIATAFILKHVVRKRLVSWSGRLLWLALAIQHLLMAYTGRFEDGMWIVAGLTFWLAVTDLVFNALTVSSQTISVALERKVSIASFGILSAGILVGFISRPFDQAQKRYLDNYLSTMAAYRAIGEDTNQITLVRLRPSTEWFHPGAFWIGHNIFWKHPGLWYYNQEATTYPRNMAIQTYTNASPKAFQEILVHRKRTPQNYEVLLFEDQNLFFRLFLDSENPQMLRVIPITPVNPQTLAIYLPFEMPYRGAPIRVRYALTFDQPLVGPQKILFNGSLIEDWDLVENNKLQFLSDRLDRGEIQMRASNARLIQVDVFELHNGKDESPSTPKNKITVVISSPTALCSFGLASDTGVQFSGTLDAGTLVAFNPLLPGPLKGNYSTIAANRSLRTTGTFNLDPSTNSAPIIVCP